MYAAMRGEVGSAACEVKVLDLKNLIRDFEADGADTLQLHVFDLDIERLELGSRSQIAWSAQRTNNVEGPIHGRVGGDFSRQIDAEKRIGIQMVEG